MKRFPCILLLLFTCLSLSAQVKDITELKQANLNWYNEDYSQRSILGVSTERAYTELLKGKTPKKTVVVAVIDSGVDIDHPDFTGKIWRNEDEIPGDGIDNDQNGYIDDVHGWSFLGNRDGRNINFENMEVTRILKTEDEESPFYARSKAIYDKELKKQEEDRKAIQKFKMNYQTAIMVIKNQTGIEVNEEKDLYQIDSKEQDVVACKNFLVNIYTHGFKPESLKEWESHIDDYFSYYLNMDFNPREVVGDDPLDLDDRDYGNPDVTGPRANHGTGVAGVIAAVRNNGIGIDGVAEHVKIMPIRSTPNGDERDKDVALAIRYAVDNGADIINMSFGKPISPQKHFVDDAVRYAQSKGVLMIHGSGNDGRNIDLEESYPSDVLLDGTIATNWLSVGANQMEATPEYPAYFSNYGKKNVDVFAPGVDIISLDTVETYSMNSGTSLAAPIASGVAALVLSYYPDLTPEELIDILMTSSLKVKSPKKVILPNEDQSKPKKVKFSTLSTSGGIVNVYHALVEAERRIGAGK